MSQQQHIFISYSRRNTKIMITLRQQLTRASFRVWTDENLVAGTPSWKNAIEQAIQNSFCIVVLMSPDSKKSEWVERELDYAYMLKRRIFPVLVAGAPQNAIPFELINIQYVDLRVDFDDKVLFLISGLKAFAGNQQVTDIRETSPPDDFDERVEARVHQLIGNLPEELRNKISISDTGELESVADKAEIEMPDIPLPVNGFGEGFESEEQREKRLAGSLKMIGWYFVAPQKLSRFRSMFLSKASIEVNAILSITMLVTLIFVRSLSLAYFTSPLFLCAGSILIPVAGSVASYGSPKNSYRSYLWAVGKGMLIIILIIGIVALVGAMSSLIYFVGQG